MWCPARDASALTLFFRDNLPDARGLRHSVAHCLTDRAVGPAIQGYSAARNRKRYCDGTANLKPGNTRSPAPSSAAEDG